MNQSEPNRIFAVSYCIIPSHADSELGAFTIVDFPLGEWKILNGSDNPIADGIISDCLVTDRTIPDVFLTKLMEKASWATLTVR